MLVFWYVVGALGCLSLVLLLLSALFAGPSRGSRVEQERDLEATLEALRPLLSPLQGQPPRDSTQAMPGEDAAADAFRAALSPDTPGPRKPKWYARKMAPLAMALVSTMVGGIAAAATSGALPSFAAEGSSNTSHGVIEAVSVLGMVVAGLIAAVGTLLSGMAAWCTRQDARRALHANRREEPAHQTPPEPNPATNEPPGPVPTAGDDPPE